MSRGIGDQKLLQKRIPKSARYDNVRAKTDTGASMSKHLARVNEIQNNYRIQKGEEMGASCNFTYLSLLATLYQIFVFHQSYLNEFEYQLSLNWFFKSIK